jgi:hypothetical protein
MLVGRGRRIALWTLLVAMGIAVVGVLGGFIYMQVPCAEARQLRALYRDRHAPAAAGNAFFDVYGFAAPADVDAHGHGMKRIAWISRMRTATEIEADDPASADIAQDGERKDASSKLGALCREGPARLCADAFRAVAEHQRLSPHEELLLQRYETLLGRPDWFETLPFRDGDPLPDYGLVLEAQRIRMVHLRWNASRLDTAALRDALQRDLEFWRRVQLCADGLITKMIAIAAIRFHFIYANLVLAELPPERQLASLPPSWLRPISDEERSMWRAMAGEYDFMTTAIRQAYDQGLPLSENELADDMPSRVLGGFLRQVVPRRMANDQARLYALISTEFAVPLDRYEQARDSVLGASPHRDARATALYAFRIGSVEGMRRAAVLVARLRSRAVPLADVEDELRKADLRRPFDGKPFAWAASDRAVLHEGPEKKRDAIALFY